MQSEKIRIPAFGVLPIPASGTLGLSAGNAQYCGYCEGIDNMRLAVGQCLPLATAKAELVNPWSFPFEGQIIRGAPVNLGTNGALAENHLDLTKGRGGIILATEADNLRRRGVGFMSKRGAYRITLTSIGGTVSDLQVMYLRGARAEFVAFKPATCFMDTPPKVYRNDGSVNDQIVTVAGSYSQADIDAWKAAVGYTSANPAVTCNVTVAIEVDAETAVFFTCSAPNFWRVLIDVEELGDFTSGRRIVGGN